jgi:hypothetical protein
MLHWIADNINWNSPSDICYWGLIATAYFFLLRRSEIIYDGVSCKWYTITRSDIKFWNEDGTECPRKYAKSVSINLRGSKSDQQGEGATRSMDKSGHKILCPVRAAKILTRQYDKNHDNRNLPIAQAPGFKCDVREATKWIKAAASACNYKNKKFGFHSLRIGGATTLLNADEDSTKVKLLGRWKSNAFEGYPRITHETTRGLSSKLV